jgi:L-fuconolactonase
MNIIDAHHHVWDLSVRDQDWIRGPDMGALRRSFSMADLRPEAERAGVTASVLVQTVTVRDETPEMLALAASDPLVSAVVGWVDLTAESIADDLAALVSGPGGRYLSGIRHQVQSEPDPDWLRRADVLRGLRAVAAAGLSYDLVIRPHQLPSASYAAAAVPELFFILDHAGKPAIASGQLEPWAGSLRELAAHPNTACKLSGLVTEAAPTAPPAAYQSFAAVILSAFGPERVMFGSDWWDSPKRSWPICQG